MTADVNSTCFQVDLLGGRTKKRLTQTFVNETGIQTITGRLILPRDTESMIQYPGQEVRPVQEPLDPSFLYKVHNVIQHTKTWRYTARHGTRQDKIRYYDYDYGYAMI